MRNYKIGDKGIVRSWESMENEFGSSKIYVGLPYELEGPCPIKVSDFRNLYFSPDMKFLCGTEIVVTTTSTSGYFWDAEGWLLSPEMIIGGWHN